MFPFGFYYLFVKRTVLKKDDRKKRPQAK